jgi:hypothetical protein
VGVGVGVRVGVDVGTGGGHAGRVKISPVLEFPPSMEEITAARFVDLPHPPANLTLAARTEVPPSGTVPVMTAKRPGASLMTGP